MRPDGAGNGAAQWHDAGLPVAAPCGSFLLGVIEVIRFESGPGSVQLDSCPDGVDVLFQRSGRSALLQASVQLRLEQAVICLAKPGHDLQLKQAADSELYLLRIPRVNLQLLVQDCRPLCLTTISACCGTGAILSQMVHSIYVQRSRLAAADYKYCSDAVLSLLGSFLRNHGREIGEEASVAELYHLQRVKAFALENLASSELDVRLIAEEVGLSVSYIHRLFAGSTMTLMQWINAERLDACHRELSSPCRLKRPVYAVAQDWGFSSQAHFSRAFRARFGVSPSAVRTGERKGAAVQQDSDPCCSE